MKNLSNFGNFGRFWVKSGQEKSGFISHKLQAEQVIKRLYYKGVFDRKRKEIRFEYIL